MISHPSHCSVPWNIIHRFKKWHDHLKSQFRYRSLRNLATSALTGPVGVRHMAAPWFSSIVQDTGGIKSRAARPQMTRKAWKFAKHQYPHQYHRLQLWSTLANPLALPPNIIDNSRTKTCLLINSHINRIDRQRFPMRPRLDVKNRQRVYARACVWPGGRMVQGWER